MPTYDNQQNSKIFLTTHMYHHVCTCNMYIVLCLHGCVVRNCRACRCVVYATVGFTQCCAVRVWNTCIWNTYLKCIACIYLYLKHMQKWRVLYFVFLYFSIYLCNWTLLSKSRYIDVECIKIYWKNKLEHQY